MKLALLAVVGLTAKKSRFRNGRITAAVSSNFIAEEASASSANFMPLSIVVVVITKKSWTRSTNFFAARVIMAIAAKKPRAGGADFLATSVVVSVAAE